MNRPALSDIKPVHWLGVVGILAVTAAVELAMGRHAICTCGYVDLWHPYLDAGNSQHIADWYTLSHIIHGFLFYLLGWLVLRARPPGERLILAVAIEAAWEMLENSPIIINRYRAATISLDYYGDSIINSVSDTLAMVLGYFLARVLPVSLTLFIAVALELFVGAMIRDNFTLNILMFLWPIESVLHWQQGR